MTYSEFLKHLVDLNLISQEGELITEDSPEVTAYTKFIPSVDYSAILKHYRTIHVRPVPLYCLLQSYYKQKIEWNIKCEKVDGSTVLLYNFDTMVAYNDELQDYVLVDVFGKILNVPTVLYKDTMYDALSMKERTYFDFMRLVSCVFPVRTLRNKVRDIDSELFQFFKVTSQAYHKCPVSHIELLSIYSRIDDNNLLRYSQGVLRLTKDVDNDYANILLNDKHMYVFLPKRTLQLNWELLPNFKSSSRLMLALVCYVLNLNCVQTQWNCCKALYDNAVLPAVNSEYAKAFNMHDFLKSANLYVL